MNTYNPPWDLHKQTYVSPDLPGTARSSSHLLNTGGLLSMC